MNESVNNFNIARSMPIEQFDLRLPYGVFSLEQHNLYAESPLRYCRSFYKIALIRGENRCHYASKSIRVSDSTLMFFSPDIPYTWESCSNERGYFCMFRESFFAEGSRKDIKQLSMFASDCKLSFALSPEMDERISAVFIKMLGEETTASSYFYDLSHAYISELIYFALGMVPVETSYPHSNAKLRLTKVFFALLERQFASVYGQLAAPLRSASQYAKKLNVHVNHLNDAVKRTTGKTTTQHICEQTSAKAQTLLKITQLNVSEIGYRLGFEEPAHFYNFFKKLNGLSPSDYRKKFSADHSGIPYSVMQQDQLTERN